MYDIWLAIVALDKVFWWYQREEYISRPKNHFLSKETSFWKLWSLMQNVPLTYGFKALYPLLENKIKYSHICCPPICLSSEKFFLKFRFEGKCGKRNKMLLTFFINPAGPFLAPKVDSLLYFLYFVSFNWPLISELGTFGIF